MEAAASKSSGMISAGVDQSPVMTGVATRQNGAGLGLHQGQVGGQRGLAGFSLSQGALSSVPSSSEVASEEGVSCVEVSNEQQQFPLPSQQGQEAGAFSPAIFATTVSALALRRIGTGPIRKTRTKRAPITLRNRVGIINLKLDYQPQCS
jgi:hypothetical protein